MMIDAVRLPEDLLSKVEWHALNLALSSRAVASWQVFRRRELHRTALSLPMGASVAPKVMRLSVSLRDDVSNAIELRLPLLAEERIVGFGERFNAVNQRGWQLETWTEEGAVGVGETLSPLLTRLGVKWNPLLKGPTTSYKPLPWFMSSRGYGLLAESSAPIFYDVGVTEPNILRMTIFAKTCNLLIFTDATPAQLVERMTALTGRTPGVPDWALAPWNDAIGGSAEVRRVAALLRREGIPSAAIWYEDWQGGYWRRYLSLTKQMYSIFPVYREPDRTLYPDIETVNSDLHRAGFKALSYYYPYINPTDPAYPQAVENGYLVKDAAGKVLTFPILDYATAQIDLTNPAARAWYKEELRRGLSYGFDGWMADFGEYTPPSSKLASGEDGLRHHNAYPGLWAELNREMFTEERPDGDFAFFSRSASIGQQAISPFFWSGDSQTDFERWDGLPSNPRGLLSAGLSGLSIWAADVGGYMSLNTRGRDAETLARWTEFAALLPVMRTHHGTNPRQSVQFDHDARTLAHYRTYARLHTALYPLFRMLIHEAQRTGLPVCRALLLHYPDDATAWEIDDQFLLGPDVLVAPVIARGSTARRVYLPGQGEWIDLWQGTRHSGGQWVTSPAPIGVIPLFLRAEGCLPFFDHAVDTFVRRAQVADPTIRTLDDAEKSIALVIGSAFTGRATLYNGTTVALAAGEKPPSLAASPPFAVETLPPDLIAHWQAVATGNGASVFLPWGDGTITISGKQSRQYTLYHV